MESKEDIESELKAVLEINATDLIENLSNGDIYEKNPNVLQNLRIVFAQHQKDAADVAFEKILQLLDDKGLSGKIISLDVSDRFASDYIGLSKLPVGLRKLNAMTLLNVGSNQLTTLRDLQHCPALTSLNAYANQLKTLEGLEYCSALTSLDVTSNHLTTLEGLQRCSALASLDVSGNTQLITLQSLQYCPDLRSLTIAYNRLITLKDLQYCRALTSLVVIHNHLTTLEGLQYCPALTSLDLSCNQLTAVSVSVGIGNLTALKQLNIDENRLQKDILMPIEEFKTQFFKLQQTYRRLTEIRDFMDDNVLMLPSAIKQIIFLYDDVFVSNQPELRDLSTGELILLRERLKPAFKANNGSGL